MPDRSPEQSPVLPSASTAASSRRSVSMLNVSSSASWSPARHRARAAESSVRAARRLVDRSRGDRFARRSSTVDGRGGGIEIAHEALIDSWPRLRSWIDDDRDGIRMHRHLTSAASAWAELGRDEGELYRGARLSAALSWVADATPDLSDLDRDFIDAAVGMSEAQLRQQVRANRRLRILVAASVVGSIAAAAGSSWPSVRRRRPTGAERPQRPGNWQRRFAASRT